MTLVPCGATAVAAVNFVLGKAGVKRTTGVRLRVPRLDNDVELETLTPAGLLNMMKGRLASATGDITLTMAPKKVNFNTNSKLKEISNSCNEVGKNLFVPIFTAMNWKFSPL